MRHGPSVRGEIDPVFFRARFPGGDHSHVDRGAGLNLREQDAVGGQPAEAGGIFHQQRGRASQHGNGPGNEGSCGWVEDGVGNA